MGFDVFIKTPSGEIIPIDSPLPKAGIYLKNAGRVNLKIVERQLRFKKDQCIKLAAKDLAEICNLILLSSNEIYSGSVSYAKKIGISIKKAEKKSEIKGICGEKST